MFGSDNFPLGPAGGYPKQRINSFNRRLIPGVSAQDTYLSGGSSVSKLPNLERDFHSSNNKAKGRLSEGSPVRSGGSRVDRFKPRYARSRNGGLRGEEEGDFEPIMDTDPIYDASGIMMDEGETDDSVGYYRGRGTDFRGRMSPFAGLLKRGVARRR